MGFMCMFSYNGAFVLGKDQTGYCLRLARSPDAMHKLFYRIQNRYDYFYPNKRPAWKFYLPPCQRVSSCFDLFLAMYGGYYWQLTIVLPYWRVKSLPSKGKRIELTIKYETGHLFYVEKESYVPAAEGEWRGLLIETARRIACRSKERDDYFITSGSHLWRIFSVRLSCRISKADCLIFVKRNI